MELGVWYIGAVSKINQFIPNLGEERIGSNVPTYEKDEQIDLLCMKLKALNTVTKKLQRDLLSLYDVQKPFNVVMAKYPSTNNRLKPDSNIVFGPSFETAIIKAQSIEEAHLEIFRKPSTNTCTNSAEPDVDSLSFAERALKRRRPNPSQVVYADTRFVSPATNLGERIFSKTHFLFNKQRKSFTPANLRIQLFLDMNKELWCS